MTLLTLHDIQAFNAAIEKHSLPFSTTFPGQQTKAPILEHMHYEILQPIEYMQVSLCSL